MCVLTLLRVHNAYTALFRLGISPCAVTLGVDQAGKKAQSLDLQRSQGDWSAWRIAHGAPIEQLIRNQAQSTGPWIHCVGVSGSETKEAFCDWRVRSFTGGSQRTLNPHLKTHTLFAPGPTPSRSVVAEICTCLVAHIAEQRALVLVAYASDCEEAVAPGSGQGHCEQWRFRGFRW